MKKPHIIYIHGKLGAGKSSTANLVAQELGFERISAGYFFRNAAKEKGFKDFRSFQDHMNSSKEINEEINGEIDRMQKKYIEQHAQSGIVCDGRLGFFLIPEAFHVFLEVDEETAAKRIWEDMQTNEERSIEKGETLEAVLDNMKYRNDSESIRMRTLYGIDDHMDHDHFNLVINTKNYQLDQVNITIQDQFEKWLKSSAYGQEKFS